jgi:hypothetical protein
MWRNPKYEHPEPPAPPELSGDTLAVFDPGQVKTLRVSRELYERHPFICLRLWLDFPQLYAFDSRPLRLRRVRLRTRNHLEDGTTAAMPRVTAAGGQAPLSAQADRRHSGFHQQPEQERRQSDYGGW